MTEQSKIPVPSEGEKASKTLIERVQDTTGLPGFTFAPVPRKLAKPTNRQVAKPVAEPMPHQADEEPAMSPVVAGVPTTKPAQALVRRIDFSGEVHPVNQEALREAGLIVPDGRVSALLEEFRIVKRQVLLAMQESANANAQRVLVCSPLPGEGKTFSAINLALAMAAERDTEVLLVDADFARPSVLSRLGMSDGLAKDSLGLMDALADPDVAVEDCVLATDISGLFVLPAGNRTTYDSEFLSSTRTTAVLDRLTQGAPNRIVIFDSPPALAASPAADIAKHVGQALVVVRADQTGQSALEDTLTLLSACPDIKLLLNAANFSPSGRRFGDYYNQGG